MQIGLGKLGKVEIDHDVYRNDIDAASEQVSADEAARVSIFEVVEDSVAIGLGHPGVDEEAGVAKLVNFLSEEFNSLCSVAENDCLRNVQLAEESVEAVELLSLFEERVVLSQTLESEFIGNADENGVGDVVLHKIFDLDRVRSTEHHNLPVVVHHGKNVLDSHALVCFRFSSAGIVVAFMAFRAVATDHCVPRHLTHNIRRMSTATRASSPIHADLCKGKRVSRTRTTL